MREEKREEKRIVVVYCLLVLLKVGREPASFHFAACHQRHSTQLVLDQPWLYGTV